ncbi:hypothetical protein PSEUBRA_002238 [Kalmanozyma brasiliensis GHG001]|uniref:uncharacterized protein n=1 Tax=Kalmanozyma brasiliensis (strain GHG001) TaxID=1365824 RepID=UPI002868172E|nr:uncharacterized protein PSEUBRA_002238 [Kalmanozyma brasiliensis GHG001]KAF6767059.1 hypothetical protein PSEUBRA_002238 [Kalmanozyma brasiliensis GHG001]
MSSTETPASSLSSAALQTSFTVSSDAGVDLKVSTKLMHPRSGQTTSIELADSLSTPPRAAGCHFVVTGTASSSESSEHLLDDRCIWAIAQSMLEDINSLRDGWLHISALHARSSAYVETEGDASTSNAGSAHLEAIRHSIVVMLAPASIPDRGTVNRRWQVDLDWTDSRVERTRALADLLSSPTLPSQLRDLVSQMTSRLLLETLLADPEIAELYHRSWQQRQQDVSPLIDSIANSMRSLAANATKSVELDALLHQLEPTKEIPSVITVSNILTRMDIAAHPPTRERRSPARARRKRSDQSDPTEDAIVGLAPGASDSDYSWIDTEAEPSTVDVRGEHNLDNVPSSPFAPEAGYHEEAEETNASFEDPFSF